MPNSKRLYSPAVRKRKAYWTAFLVLSSYLWLQFKSRFFGAAYAERRLPKLHQKNAARIQKRVQELQGLFIKFGQLISNLSNVLPAEFRQPLEELQDHVKAKPFEEVQQTIKEQLGKSPEELFTNFDKVPIAAASIGQVHRATLNEVEVVVKVQHRNIDTIAHADLAILKRLVKIHGYFMNMQGLNHTYEQVQQMIEEELDFTKEASSMQRVAKNLEKETDLNVQIPKVFAEYSSSKIIVLSYCEGKNLGQIETLQSWGLDLEDIARRLTELYCKMVLVDGFYHADPHPGNILVNKDGAIILLDFGAVAELSAPMKKAIPGFIEAVVKNDTEETVIALRNMGFIGSDKASRKFVEKLLDLFKNFLQEEVQLDGMNFQNIKLNSGLGSIASLISQVDLRSVSNTIRIPKDYILLNRTIVLLMGNSFRLAPTLNSLEVVRPYIKNHVLKEDLSFRNMIINTFKSQLAVAISLPNDLSKLLKTANKGELEFQVSSLENGLERLLNLGQQFLYSFLLIAALLFHLNYPSAKNSPGYFLNWGLILLFGWYFLRAFFKRIR